MVLEMIGDDVRPAAGELVVVHESPLVPSTVQFSASLTFQYSLTGLCLRTSAGFACRWPVAVNAPPAPVAENSVNDISLN